MKHMYVLIRLQSWIFMGRTDAEDETPILWPPNEKTHWKKSWCWKILKADGKGDNRGRDSCMTSPTRRTWVWALGVGDGQGSLMCCSPWGLKELDMTKWLNWTELIVWSALLESTYFEFNICGSNMTFVIGKYEI